jgi:hypothetical protein
MAKLCKTKAYNTEQMRGQSGVGFADERWTK